MPPPTKPEKTRNNDPAAQKIAVSVGNTSPTRPSRPPNSPPRLTKYWSATGTAAATIPAPSRATNAPVSVDGDLDGKRVSAQMARSAPPKQKTSVRVVPVTDLL